MSALTSSQAILRVQARRFFMGPNIWPPRALLSDHDFRETAEQYHAVMLELAKTIMHMIAYTLPYGPNVFDAFVANQPVCPLRFLHYPTRRPEPPISHSSVPAPTLTSVRSHCSCKTSIRASKSATTKEFGFLYRPDPTRTW